VSATLDSAVVELGSRVSGQVVDATLARLEARVAELERRLARLDPSVRGDRLAAAVIAACCGGFRCDRDAFFKQDRSAPLPTARGLAAEIMRRRFGWSFPRIARELRRDHSSVIHMIRRLERGKQRDRHLAERCNDIEAAFDSAMRAGDEP
jgi:hypothetical protein